MLENDLFEIYQELIEEKIGVYVYKEQESNLFRIIKSRLNETKIKSTSEYLSYLRNQNDKSIELKKIINLLTVNETYFYRDCGQFETLKKYIIPEIINKKNNKSLRIWCAGCSTGEEPFTVAIIIKELQRYNPQISVSILATDINCDVLEKAKKGNYSARSVSKLPSRLRDKYFVKNGLLFDLKDEIKQMVSFKQHNLVNDV